MADEQNRDMTTQPDAAATPAPSAVMEKKNIITLVREWPLPRKIGLGAILAVTIALFAVLIMQARTANQQLLYASLPAADASQIITWLKEQKIPYSLKNQGRDIWVAADKIYQTRLDLAANGMPSGGGVGFEIFDKQSFALTDYVQKVNMTRAMQGELARTITSLAPVEATRVHLALPEKRLFNKQPKKATASIILTLKPGKTLTPQQVQGIVHLVASSVPALEPENVQVIDQNGVVLEREKQQKEGQLFTEDMLSFQQEVENRMEMRAQDLLDRTMGKDNAMVRVSAILDFAKVEKTQEFFDGDDPVIRSEQIKQEFNSNETDSGIPGVESNMQGNSLEATGTASSLSRNSTIVNYEISKTISKIVNPVGTIHRLSVSVLVADRVIAGDHTGNGPTTRPRTPEELLAIENMVARAIGLDSERGDMISVQSMPFVTDSAEAIEASPPGGEDYYYYLPFIKYGLIALGLFLIYLLLLRPVIKTMKGEVKQHYKTVEEMQQRLLEKEAAKTAPDANGENPLPRLPVNEMIRQVRREIMEDQVPTAFILKNWLQQG